MEDTVRTIRAKLGEFEFDVHGHRLRAYRLRFRMLCPKTIKRIRESIINDTWRGWMNSYREIIMEQVRDWDELTFEDLWADPYRGMLFLREIARG